MRLCLKEGCIWRVGARILAMFAGLGHLTGLKGLAIAATPR